MHNFSVFAGWLAIIVCVTTGNSNGLTVFPHGTFVPETFVRTDDNLRCSDNGAYRCEFEIGLSDQNRRMIRQLKVYENDRLINTVSDIPGDDFSVSNAGYVVAYDLQYKEGGNLTVRVFDKKGAAVLERVFQRASLFGFSESGKKYAVGSYGKFEVFHLPTGQVQVLPWTDQFAISGDDALIAIARDDGIGIYSEHGLHGTIVEPMAVNYVRKIQFSDDNKTVVFIGKNKLVVYNTDDLSRRFIDEVNGYLSFADLRITGSEIHAGIHLRNEETVMSHGIIRTYSLDGTRFISERECAKACYMSDTSKLSYNYAKDMSGGQYTIPWPFEPQDKAKMEWNGFCQNVAAGTGTGGAYLHQGTDMDVSTRDRCVAVESGICKCHLTMGGDLYWRIATCTVNVAERRNGWLYAHLVKNSITKQPGDKVTKGEFLATIVAWTSASLVNGAHLHFSHISDDGTKWNVSDANEWDNERNPMVYLRPSNDTKAPEFLDAFPNSKFAFTTNDNASPTFIKNNVLSGEVDIYAHISDQVGDSPWKQPAVSLFYWIRSLDNGTMVVPRTIGLIRNQRMKGYGGAGASNDYTNLVPVMYRCDREFPAIGWSDRKRHHLQNVTNSNGDSLVTVGHKKNALNTAKFNDGKYRIYIEASDAAPNTAIDSMDVSFKNGITGITTDDPLDAAECAIRSVLLSSNTLSVTFSVPLVSDLQFHLYDIRGALVADLSVRQLEKGMHTKVFNGSFSSGMYFLKMKTSNVGKTIKVVTLK